MTLIMGTDSKEDTMVYFGLYLKDYLEDARISQTDFSNRLGITQKHMNEILNGKKNITMEMAGNIERLTGIDAKFIMKIENSRKLRENLMNQFESEENLDNYIKHFPFNELKKRKWLVFKDETNVFQICIDLLDFLKVKDFTIFNSLEKKVLFKKQGEDYKKLSLWIARCDQLSQDQDVKEYNSKKFDKLIEELKVEAYSKEYNEERIRILLNNYGILFVVEKALPGTKVRGVFKVNGNNPAIYLTKNYTGKDSFYFELFHELKHCKSNYNEAKNKIFAGGDDQKEKEADEFALETMISNEIWKKILNNYVDEEHLMKISKDYRIPMSFIVGRLAYYKLISYRSYFYQNYKNE
jgi:HTH-type transcriptional regulator / antitoxin HigA